MKSNLLDGKALSQTVRATLKIEVDQLRTQGVVPGLAVILVGADPASQVYVRNKAKAAREAGIRTFDHHLPESTTEEELTALLRRLNNDTQVDGVLVQLPLPGHLSTAAETILQVLDPEKDVDGLLSDNVGRLWLGRPRFVPCTPLGVMSLLQQAEQQCGVTLRGAEAVVIGRSHLVGRPMGALLLSADATVTICHSRTRNLPEVISRADVLVAAIGRPEMIKGSWIKEGATVIDVGINRLPDGRLVGDVEFGSARERAAAITPVPGGVGPMTIAMLLSNTVAAAARHAAVSR